MPPRPGFPPAPGPGPPPPAGPLPAQDDKSAATAIAQSVEQQRMTYLPPTPGDSSVFMQPAEIAESGGVWRVGAVRRRGYAVAAAKLSAAFSTSAATAFGCDT